MFVEVTFTGWLDIHWTEVPVISIVCSTGLRPTSLPVLILAGLLKLLAAIAFLPLLAAVITVLPLLAPIALLPLLDSGRAVASLCLDPRQVAAIAGSVDH